MKYLSGRTHDNAGVNNVWVCFFCESMFLLILLLVSQNSWSNEIKLNVDTLTPAIVLDFELLGDTSIESLKAQDALAIEKFSKQFRQQLKLLNIFSVIDDEQSLARIQKEAQRQYLHRCNGCELDLGRQLGAKVVIVPWVFRMSAMIQVMNFEIRDVQTGKLIMKRPYDFRGTNDKAWDRALRYALKDIKKAAAQFRE